MTPEPKHVHTGYGTPGPKTSFAKETSWPDDHRRFTLRHQGRDFRLTDAAGTIVPELLG
jgi:hypothetical protein